MHRVSQNNSCKKQIIGICFNKSTKFHIRELEILSIYFFNIVRMENVMKLRAKMVVLCAIACFAFGIAGCGEKGNAEKAGKKVDKSLESAKDAIHDATK